MNRVMLALPAGATGCPDTWPDLVLCTGGCFWVRLAFGLPSPVWGASSNPVTI